MFMKNCCKVHFHKSNRLHCNTQSSKIIGSYGFVADPIWENLQLSHRATDSSQQYLSTLSFRTVRQGDCARVLTCRYTNSSGLRQKKGEKVNGNVTVNGNVVYFLKQKFSEEEKGKMVKGR